VQPLADDYRTQVGVDLFVVTGRDSQLLAWSGFDASDLAASLVRSSRRAEVSTFSPQYRGVLQVISVPILIGVDATEMMGRLTVGFFFDDALANQFKKVTGSEIAFGADGRVLASTVTDNARDQLASAMGSDGISTLRIGNEEFIALRRPLGPPPDSRTFVLILRSRTARLQFLDTIRTGLVGALVVTVLLATIVSYAVARTMTRPLAAISSAMRDMAATGDLTRKVALHSSAWDDEDARLLAATFNTLTDSITRFQKEAAQRERLSSLGRLSTVIAHEIRNPLMIIKTTLRGLRRDDVTSSEVRDAVHDIDEQATRLNRIVTEVLDFARPMRFDYADAELNSVCSTSADAVSAGEAGPAIALDLDASNPHIVTDAERLRTALINLLINARHAIQATPAATVGTGVAVVAEPQIHLSTRRDDAGRVTITVRDHGVGIPPEDLAHIFDPYYTTRRAGTGLGLPITKNIIEGLGGTITVTSRPGKGTDIRIELPAAPADHSR
jgi:signal transduction histidine kinase